MLEDLHQRIVEKGKLAVAGEGELRRSVIEAAANYLADERNDLTFVFSGWCLAGLPHRQIPHEAEWRVENGPVVLLVRPGKVLRAGGADECVGVPYGPTARLILIYLQREALRTGSREVELGTSMRSWLGKLGIPTGGRTMNAVRDQVRRITTCSFTLQTQATGALAVKNATFVDEAILFDLASSDDRQTMLFPETVKLSEAFFQQLRDHPVPLAEAALRQIKRSSMALDIYLWLAYRLHSLRGPRPVRWAALRQQFGGSRYGQMFAFRQQFNEALEMALAVYPDAARRGVKVVEEGLILSPCDPPVAPRQKSAILPA